MFEHEPVVGGFMMLLAPPVVTATPVFVPAVVVQSCHRYENVGPFDQTPGITLNCWPSIAHPAVQAPVVLLTMLATKYG